MVTGLPACAPEDNARNGTRGTGRGTSSGAQATATATDGSGSGTRAGVAERKLNILFIGTSLTAGYGIGEAFAFPAVIQARIDSAALPFHVINAGVSGETSAGGLRRIDWMLQQPVDILVVELGANDGLRGLSVESMRENLDSILRRARETYPDIQLVLLGMEAPPNLGPDYRTTFRNVYRDLASTYDAALVPFLLDGVAAQPSLNLDDGIHPNLEGQRRVADNVWDVLGPLLRERVSR